MAYSHIAMVIGIQEICRLIKGCGIKKRQSKLHILTTKTSVLQTYFNTIILLWIIRASPTGSSVTLSSPTRNTRGANGTFELSLPPFFNRFQVEYGKKSLLLFGVLSCPGPRPAVVDHVPIVYARDLNCQWWVKGHVIKSGMETEMEWNQLETARAR